MNVCFGPYMEKKTCYGARYLVSNILNSSVSFFSINTHEV